MNLIREVLSDQTVTAVASIILIDPDVRAEYLKQGRGEHIVRVEFACMGKAVCGNFHRILLILSYILLLTV